MQLQTQASRVRRERERLLREKARQSRAVAPALVVEAPSSLTVWRTRDLPTPRTAAVGVPLSEGVTSVIVG